VGALSEFDLNNAIANRYHSDFLPGPVSEDENPLRWPELNPLGVYHALRYTVLDCVS